MIKKIFFLFIVLSLSGCTGIIHTVNYSKSFPGEIKSAYIISTKKSQYVEFKFGIIIPFGYIPLADDPAVETEVIGNTANVIKEELEKHGIRAIIGEKGDTPIDFDIIVEYNDVWRWDFKKILEKLEIFFITPDGKEVISKSTFLIKNKEIHNFPSPEKEVPKMIDEMLTQ